jgi:hypothetical protein
VSPTRLRNVISRVIEEDSLRLMRRNDYDNVWVCTSDGLGVSAVTFQGVNLQCTARHFTMLNG